MPKNVQTTTQLHSSHTLLLVILKILQARLQQNVNCEIPNVQTGFRKGRGTRDQITNIRWIMEKAREFQKNIYFGFIDYVKAFDCVDHNKLWKILKEMGIPDHLTCLLRNLYAGQEATVSLSIWSRIKSNQTFVSSLVDQAGLPLIVPTSPTFSLMLVFVFPKLSF